MEALNQSNFPNPSSDNFAALLFGGGESTSPQGETPGQRALREALEHIRINTMAQQVSTPVDAAPRPQPDSRVDGNRSTCKADGSILQYKDGELERVTTVQGGITDFQYENGHLTRITLSGNKRVIECKDGKWKLTEKKPDGKEVSSDLSDPPKVLANGDYEIKVDKEGTRLYKTNGAAVYTRADGNVTRIDYTDGTFRTIEWKGEGSAAKESVVRTYRADGGRAEQLQLNDLGIFDRFTWAAGASPESFFRGLQVEGFKVYKGGEVYIKGKYDYRPSYEQTDKSQIQYERVDLGQGKELWRPTQIMYGNGDKREFGYFGNGLDLRYIKTPEGTELTRTAANTELWTYTRRNTYSTSTDTLTMTASMTSDNVYTYQVRGRERVIALGGGQVITELQGGARALGNEKRLIYSPSGRIIELDDKKDPVKIIEPNGGLVWSLTDKKKSEWTSATGEKRIITVKDGEYWFVDDQNRKHTFKKNGRELIESKTAGTSIEKSGETITSFTGPDRKTISYDYDKDGPSSIKDAHGWQWQHKVGTDQWTLARNGTAANYTGRMSIAADGSYTFTGTGEHSGLVIAARTDGTILRSKGNEAIHINADGTTVKVESEGDGGRRVPTKFTKYDARGVEQYSFVRDRANADPFKTVWKSEKLGELTADITVSEKAELLFRTKSADGSVLEKDDRGITHRITYPNGDRRSFITGKDSEVQEESFLRSGEREPVVWKRKGTTDWWISNQGEVTQRDFVRVRDGVYTYRSTEGDVTINTAGRVAVTKDGVAAIEEALPRQKSQLIELARTYITDRRDLADFEKNLDTFEKGAAKQKVPDKEVARTLNELCRMMVHPSEKFASSELRLQAAKEAVRIAADVISIDQGYHPTCNVTNDEVMMYWRHPSKAVKLIADLSTSGEFKANDGSIIKIDSESLLPDAEARRYPTRDGDRALASQWYQIGAINVHWQRQTKMPDGTTTDKGKIVYRQTRGAKAFVGDSMERMIDTKSGHVLMEKDKEGKERPENSPHFGLSEMADSYEQIAGDLPRGFAICNTAHGGGKGIINIKSAGELHKVLTEIKTGKTLDGNPIENPLDFPIILQVHTARRPFSGNEDMGGSGGPEGGYHVVSIWDYNPTTWEVYFKNQWGRSRDHLGRPGGQRPVHVSIMAEATIKPPQKPAPAPTPAPTPTPAPAPRR